MNDGAAVRTGKDRSTTGFGRAVGRERLRLHDERGPAAQAGLRDSFDEVREKLDRLNGNSANGVLVPDRLTTWGTTSTTGCGRCGAEARHDDRGYESAVRLHIRPVLGTIRLGRLTGSDVRRLVAVFGQVPLLRSTGTTDRPDDQRCCSAGRCCDVRRHPADPVRPRRPPQRPEQRRARGADHRNVAKLVQIPTPRYKVGTGLSGRRREEDSERREDDPALRAVRGRRDARPPARRNCSACAGKMSTSMADGPSADRSARRPGSARLDATKSEASDAVVPLPKVTRRRPVGTPGSAGAERRGSGIRVARARARVPDAGRPPDRAA